MKNVFKQLWRWSPVVTLPVAVFFVFWGLATAQRYRTFGVRYDAAPMPANLYNIGKMEYRHAIARLRHTLHLRDAATIARLPTVDLFMDERAQKTLNGRLPHSAMNYVKGHLLYPDNSLERVKVKYRGDYSQHWAHFKKSTRIKTSKKKLYEGKRAFNLIAPKFEELLNNHLSYELARIMDLPAPESDMVLFRINGQNRGIHLMVEQPEELTLRRLKRMPGDVYKGELIGKDHYRGATNNVFENPGLWEKIAVNNHYAEQARDPLIAFTDAVLKAKEDPAAHARLMGMVHEDVWARFVLYEALTQCFHFDIGHNWRLYYDPYKGFMEPLIWDPVGWHPSWRPRPGDVPNLEVNLTPLHHALLSDGQFQLARHRVAVDFFESGKDKLFLDKVDHWIARMKQAADADPHITSHFKFFDADEARHAMDLLRTNIHETFAFVRAGMLEDRGSLRYTVLKPGHIALEVTGRRPLDRLTLVPKSRPERLPTVQLITVQNGKRVATDISGAVNLQGERVIIDMPLSARFEHVDEPKRGGLKAKSLKAEPAYYELIFTDMPQELLTLNAERGEVQNGIRTENLTPHIFTEGKRIVQAKPLTDPLIWSGEVVIDKDMRITAPLLILRPGTQVKIAAGASLLIYGKLIAEGTPDKPITFSGRDADPWGVVALQGAGANGSRLRHCHFKGGSGYKEPLTEYSAMFSAHNAEDLLVRDCIFDTSYEVDDMVHTVYAGIRFERCQFLNARSDAVDLDISKARVVDCLFEGSGNDGLDLMSSEVTVTHSRFVNNGDKGISVGEGTDLAALDNRFSGNVFGVQAKDGSRAWLGNSIFVNNQQAVDAYKKNWRYAAGGHVLVVGSVFQDNLNPSKADKHSGVKVVNSSLPQAERGKRLHLDTSVDNPAGTVNLTDSDQPLFLRKVWSLLNPQTRGTDDSPNPPSL